MNDVRLDPWQVPVWAELLLAAELGEDAPGRPIYARPEPDEHDDGERVARIKVGAVLTRRLHAAEARRPPVRPTATRCGAGPSGRRAGRSGPPSSPGPTRRTRTAGASTA